jgi:NADH-quinone oxidoreductase subunit N
MAAEAFRGRGERMPIGGLGIVGLLGAGVSAVLLWNPSSSSFGVIAADNFGLFVTLVLVVVGVLTIMFSSEVVARDGIPAGEYYSLVLFALAGMIMMATASDLLVIFVALEILSLAIYVLTGIRARIRARWRRAFKYFLLGPSRARSFSTASRSPSASPAARISIAWVRSWPHSRCRTAADPCRARPAARRLCLQDFGSPFHMWTPDAYEGAPRS